MNISLVCETLVFATSGILSMHNQLVTLKETAKLEIASYDPFKCCKFLSWEKIAFINCFHFIQTITRIL